MYSHSAPKNASTTSFHRHTRIIVAMKNVPAAKGHNLDEAVDARGNGKGAVDHPRPVAWRRRRIDPRDDDAAELQRPRAVEDEHLAAIPPAHLPVMRRPRISGKGEDRVVGPADGRKAPVVRAAGCKWAVTGSILSRALRGPAATHRRRTS